MTDAALRVQRVRRGGPRARHARARARPVAGMRLASRHAARAAGARRARGAEDRDRVAGHDPRGVLLHAHEDGLGRRTSPCASSTATRRSSTTQIPDEDFLSPADVLRRRRSPSSSVDLDGDGVGEAIFDLYTGGAHCCLVTYSTTARTEIKRRLGQPRLRARGLRRRRRPRVRHRRRPLQLRPLRRLRVQPAARADLPPRRRRARRRHARGGLSPRVQRGGDGCGASTARPRTLARTRLPRGRPRALAAYAADTCSLGSCRTGYGSPHRGPRGYVEPAFLPRSRRVLASFGYDA